MKQLILIHFLSIRNNVAALISHAPRKFTFRLIFVIAAILGIYCAVFGGLHFIVSLGGLGSAIIKKVIFILFFILFFLVGISFGVLFYGTAFKSRESHFLMTLPLDRGKIMYFKFIETACLATWIPFLGVVFFFLAYSNVGKASDSGFSFFCGTNFSLAAVTPLFAAPFFVLSCFFGYLLTLLVARFFNLNKFFLTVGAILVIVCIGYFKYLKSPDQTNILYLLSDEVAFFQYAKLWFLPYSWPAYGLISFEDGDWERGLLYLANLWSLAFLCLAFVPSFGKNCMSIYFQQYRCAKKRGVEKDYVSIFFSYLRLSPYLRAFIVKDVKLFAREPSLWLQFLIFFGILFFYFVNLRRFSYHLLEPVWKNVIVFLNTFSILCIVSSMSIRFVFPQWSLEGRNFWILKLSPPSLKKIFWEKILIAGVILSVISLALISTSNYMLSITPLFSFVTLFIVLLSTITMVSISLGFGGYFANFKEEYYLKAVESLGGFIAIVITFGYIILTVALFLCISHLYFTERLTHLKQILTIALFLWTLLSVSASVISLWLGMKRLSQMEY